MIGWGGLLGSLSYLLLCIVLLSSVQVRTIPGARHLFIDGVERKVVLQTSQGNFDSGNSSHRCKERDIMVAIFLSLYRFLSKIMVKFAQIFFKNKHDAIA